MRRRQGDGGLDPRLREGYRRCADLTWRYGTTYFWGAALLPRHRRRHVYAVYALCRLADDIVDLPDSSSPELVEGRSSTGSDRVSVGERLEVFADSFRTALMERTSTDPVIAAIVHTVITCGIEPECFERFFGAMAMDLTISSYETWEDLCGYMEGSAAVIGEMMLPVLEPRDPAAKAPARALGLAFQLTNFLRDVNEDLDRGRVYLPQADLRRFGVDLETRRATPEFRALMAYEIERNRALYNFADSGIAMLPARSARCVGNARVLYARILDRIEDEGYEVFAGRVRVPTWRKALTTARIMVTGPQTSRGMDDDRARSLSNVTSDAS
ncbi:MAG TPA: phytoene/squalene synthase family protein [Propionibacteriaceae bacterium]|nr:phytoene/squalene synthase family protein [Propionibacteriaceae bacterium]